MPSPLNQAASQLNVNPEHTFDALKSWEGQGQAIAAVRAVIAGNRPMVLIYGGVGNGKTHLMESASIELYRQGMFCRRVIFPQLLDTLRMSITNKEMDGYQVILDRYCYAQRLILDDIGSNGSDNEFGDKVLEAVVCARHGRRLMTLMTTNRDIETLPERVLSRMKDKSTCFLVCNKAGDYRPKLVN